MATRTRYVNDGGANSFFTVVTSDVSYTAQLSDRHFYADPSINAVAIVLPASPVTGTVCFIGDSTGFADTNHITINGNGNTINGQATLVLKSSWQSVVLSYDGPGTCWSVCGATLPLLAPTVITQAGFSSPYTVLSTDSRVHVSTTTTAYQVNLPASPATGRTVSVKDKARTAATRNITVSGNGHNIDGSATVVINVNGTNLDFIYDGTEWAII